MNEEYDPIGDIRRLREYEANKKYGYSQWRQEQQAKNERILKSLYISLEDFEKQKISPDSFQGVLPMLIYQSLH